MYVYVLCPKAQTQHVHLHHAIVGRMTMDHHLPPMHVAAPATFRDQSQVTDHSIRRSERSYDHVVVTDCHTHVALRPETSSHVPQVIASLWYKGRDHRRYVREDDMA